MFLCKPNNENTTINDIWSDLAAKGSEAIGNASGYMDNVTKVMNQIKPVLFVAGVELAILMGTVIIKNIQEIRKNG